MLVQNRDLVGQNTSPILVDENPMRLGDVASHNSIFQTSCPAQRSANHAAALNLADCCPIGPAIFHNLVELSDTFLNHPTEKFFTANFELSKQFVSVSHLNNKPGPYYIPRTHLR